MMRLSTGLRINSAREDAAGLAISNKLRNQVGALDQSSQNATHGISLVQTAEGALNEVHNMLQRMRELAVQAATDTVAPDQKDLIQREVDQLIDEINSIATNTEFNRMRILNGEADRITEMFVRTGTGDTAVLGPQTRSSVTPLFVTGVQPGRLDFTIVQPGTMAVTQIDPPTAAATMSGTFNINGNEVLVNEGDTWETVRARMQDPMLFGGISIHANDDNDEFFLVSDIAGSEQHITITGDEALLDWLGVAHTDGVSISVGVDAFVQVNGFYDIAGEPINGGTTMGISARGNKIRITGSNGEDIRLNVQTVFNPNNGNFYFGDRDTEITGAATVKSMNIRAFGPIMLQINPSHNTAMAVQIPRLNAETLGLAEFVGGEMRTKLNYRNLEGASRAIGIVDDAINTVSRVRSRLGAYQNRLESTVRSLDVASENTEISRSRIQDADIARESTRFAQYNVMFQAAMAILGQANQRPQQIISLLQ
jgi:flagellin